MLVLPHEIVTVIGRTGSGKTHLIKERLAPRHRRRITLDLTGEMRSLYPNAYHAIGLARVLRALRAWAGKEVTCWHLCAVLREDEVIRLVQLLCPVYDGRSESLAALLGGVCLEIHEVKHFLPVHRGGRAYEVFSNVLTQGRHNGLSIIAASQRAALCDRLLTSMSTAVIAFRQHEPRDVAWIREVSPWFAEQAQLLRADLYESVWYHVDSGNMEVRDKDYRVLRRSDQVVAV
jgi:hypothetical protein